MNIPPDEFAEARRMLVELLKQDGDGGPVLGLEEISTSDRLSLLTTCSAMMIEHALCVWCGYSSADASNGLDALVVDMREHIKKLCAVTIRPVDRSNYDIRHAEHPLMRECAWYATSDDALLGGVIHDRTDRDYSWLVLTQNEQGPGYTAINLATSLPTEEAATQALHMAMRQCA